MPTHHAGYLPSVIRYQNHIQGSICFTSLETSPLKCPTLVSIPYYMTLLEKTKFTMKH